MAFEKGNRPDAEEKKFVYSVEKKITKSATKMQIN